MAIITAVTYYFKMSILCDFIVKKEVKKGNYRRKKGAVHPLVNKYNFTRVELARHLGCSRVRQTL